jgi:hypothetical protein
MSVSGISNARARDIVESLRQGSVPEKSLDAFAVGLARFETALDEDLDRVAGGKAALKAIRGEYGCGKTFFSRWLADRARKRGFATSEVQISETETPLHRLETVYRRMMERLSTAEMHGGALWSVVDSWIYTLGQDVLAEGMLDESDEKELAARTAARLEQRLAEVSRVAPNFSAALRAYHDAAVQGDRATADGLLAWLSGQPNVAAGVKRAAGVKGDLDHFGALGFLQGVLTVLRDAGHRGLLVVLDEVETIQRMRGDVRERSLNALRQLVDEIHAGRFPGLYLVITGTPAFFEGPQGVQRLPPLAQRLHTDFQTDARFDNPRAAQIRLPGFDLDRLGEVGRRIRDIYATQAREAARIAAACDDAFVGDLAAAVAGTLGGKVGVAPRIFLKKLVADVLDRIDQHPDFDPRRDYALTVSDRELTLAERQARGAESVDDIELPP